jgi:uncharacterized protein YgiM (DUF1202 family)
VLASVSTSTLNVRSLPTTRSHVLGTLQQGDVVAFDSSEPGWVKIDYGTSIGFVAERFVEPIADIRAVKGRVTASLLNIRSRPTTNSQPLGAVTNNVELNILSFLDEWLEVEFNDGIGYVFRQFINLTHQPLLQATPYEVTTPLLNVRGLSNTESNILGQLKAGTKVNVTSDLGSWKAIRFNGTTGFVASAFLRVLGDVQSSVNTPLFSVHEDDNEDIDEVAATSTGSIRTDHLLPITGNATSRKVASTWNRFNPILTQLSDEKSLDVACAIAVICVESSGKGFEQNNDGRMIIRFENHKFWKYWGKAQPEFFRQHFKSDGQKSWKGHQFRARSTEPWSSFHGTQAKEWQVFDFARTLDERAAMMSISMGASQIMGFNYEAIGYLSVQSMFDKFSKSIDAHFEGLFDFCTPSMLENLRKLEFEDFAARYNGNGQKEKYGRWIQQHYQAFKTIMK